LDKQLAEVPAWWIPSFWLAAVGSLTASISNRSHLESWRETWDLTGYRNVL
jgi:hypothetical protein